MSSPPKLSASLTIQADDGTALSYYKLEPQSDSPGPPLVIIPGSMSSAVSQLELGIALSTSPPFPTVYLFSRRGRGLSGPYPPSIANSKTALLPDKPLIPAKQSMLKPTYDPEFSKQVLDIDLSDLAALMRHTQASTLIGISGGALLILAACLAQTPSRISKKHAKIIPEIKYVVIFDPPLLFASPESTHGNQPQGPDRKEVIRCETEMKSGDVASALVTAMKIVQLGPAWLRSCPRFVIRYLTKYIMSAEAKEKAAKKAAGEVDDGVTTMEGLAQLLRYDFALVEAFKNHDFELHEAIRERPVDDESGWGHIMGGESYPRHVLLLGGENSPGYMKNALSVLGKECKGKGGRLEIVQVKGVGHELLENKRRNGRVEMAVDILSRFLQGKDLGEKSAHL
jgi:pimeloyl-ACP methyl ester carboxylesterase